MLRTAILPPRPQRYRTLVSELRNTYRHAQTIDNTQYVLTHGVKITKVHCANTNETGHNDWCWGHAGGRMQSQAPPVYSYASSPSGKVATDLPPPYTPSPVRVDPAPVTSQDSGVLGPNSAIVTCPRCRSMIRTETERTTGTCTWTSAVLLAIPTCCICFWLPFCLDSCKDTRHTCPRCHTHLGTYEM